VLKFNKRTEIGDLRHLDRLILTDLVSLGDRTVHGSGVSCLSPSEIRSFCASTESTTPDLLAFFEHLGWVLDVLGP